MDSGSLALEAGLRLAGLPVVTIEHQRPPELGPKTSRRHLGGIVPGLGLHWRRRVTAGWLRSLAPERIICVGEAIAAQLRTE